MKVAIDTNPLYTTRAGVARYITGLLHGFVQVNHPDIAIEQLAWPVSNVVYTQPQRTLKTLYRELIWAPFTAPRLIEAMDANLLHITQRLPIAAGSRARTVATLHDCSVLRHPERFRTWTRLTARKYMEFYTRVDRVICISQFTADEAIHLLGIPARNLEVVHMGNSFNPSERIVSETEPEFPLPANFLLFVGSLEPGKQLQFLGEVYLLAKRSGIELPPLVIIGERWGGVPREDYMADNWIYAGRQSDGVLAYCYRRANALLFPSMYEGFGFPLLEAMSLGCPVVCSRASSLGETGGDAPAYTEHTPDAYLSTIRTLMNNQSFSVRLKEAGLVQARLFSWKKCASHTLEVYRSVVG